MIKLDNLFDTWRAEVLTTEEAKIEGKRIKESLFILKVNGVLNYNDCVNYIEIVDEQVEKYSNFRNVGFIYDVYWK